MTDITPRSFLPLQPLRWIPEIWKLAHRRLQPNMKLLLSASLVGVVAGIGAMVFYMCCQVVSHYTLVSIAGYQQNSPGGEISLFPESAKSIVPWLLLLVPTVGGLISGLIVYTFAPEAEGHGTDAAIDAYHHHGGNIRPRVPIVKIIASAITLGTGGSGGREGPIAQIGAGFGSFLGKVMRFTPRERRVLMAAGMGAGVAAIFRAPLAGALFAAEVLYRSPDFESEVVIPAGLASVMAYCTFGLAFGWNSLFTTPPNFLAALQFDNPMHLLAYTVLVPYIVVLGMLYTRSFYGITGIFHRLTSVPKHFRPMIGAFLTAVFGLALYFALSFALPKSAHPEQSLSVLSFGYGILQNGLTIDPTLESAYAFALILFLVALGKILTTGLTIGSGGSGGVFGPSMVIGGCGGGALGIVLHNLAPTLVPHPAAFVIVGMAGFFSAVAKTPFSTLVIVSEMTGGYNLLLPTLWVCTLSFLLSDEQSIYRSQVDGPARSPAHQGDYIRTVLADLLVKQFLTAQAAPALHENASLLETIDTLAASTYEALPVVDGRNRLLGMVSLNDVHLASQSPSLQALVVASDLMRTRVVPLKPDDRLDHAVELFVENNLDALPVVDDDKTLLGLVRRSDIARSYVQHVHAPPVATTV